MRALPAQTSFIMKPCPAIALIELTNIASGIKTADAMVKKSPIALLKSGTVSRGKFLVLIGGTVAAVDEAFCEGLSVAGANCIDSLMLPDVHPDVFAAAAGAKIDATDESLGILETASIAATIDAADAAIKGADVQILEMRLGDGYGGKGYALFNGKIEDVQIAMEVAGEIANRRDAAACVEIIARLHDATIRQVNGSLRFNESEQQHLADGEQDVIG